MEIHFRIIVLFSLALTIACGKEGLNPGSCPNSPIEKLRFPAQGDTSLNFQSGVYILNEGTFTFGNASISYYNPESREVIHDIFFKVNGRVLGDVLQTATIDGDQVWWVVNNSQKVELTELHTLQSKQIFAGFASPRYSILNEGSLLVSELYGAGIQKVDTASGCLEKNYGTGGWTEFFFRDVSGTLYATIRPSLNDSFTNPGILRLGATNYSFDSLPSSPLGVVSGSTVYLLLDDIDDNEVYRIGEFETLSGAFTTVATIDSLPAPPVGFVKGANNNLYFLSEGLWEFDGVRVSQVLSKTGTWYGLSVDPQKGDFYLFDAKDYVRRGMAYRLNSNFELIDSFETGIIPNSAIFF